MGNNIKEPKQCIIIRNDLKNQKGEKVRSGKLIAQACHASMGVILGMMENTPTEFIFNEFGNDFVVKGKVLKFREDCILDKWLNGIFTKVCLQCDSEQELELLYYKAKEAKLPCKLITDVGLTEFGGVPTKTCIAIGPADSDDIDKITGHLKLL